MKKTILIALFLPAAISLISFTMLTGQERVRQMDIEEKKLEDAEKRKEALKRAKRMSRLGARGPGGGYIFYDKGSYSGGWRYMEAAPEDQGEAKFGCYGKEIPGARGMEIGEGRANTAAIVEACGKAGIAARVAREYRGGGKSDWFLPSKDELNLMYQNLQQRGVGGFADNYYWSSSERDAGFAWIQHFDYGYQNGIQTSTVKDTLYPGRVRAVRAF